jgi:hypothetical protein
LADPRQHMSTGRAADVAMLGEKTFGDARSH